MAPNMVVAASDVKPTLTARSSVLEAGACRLP